MKKRNYYFACLLLLIISSCSSKNKILSNYVMYSSSDEMDSPGAIYRIDNDKKTVRLVEYRDNTPSATPIEPKEVRKSKDINVKTLMSFLSNRDTAIINHLGENAQKNISVNITIVQGQLYKMTDEDFKIYKNDLRKRIINDAAIPGNKSSMYFILNEAISAKEIYLNVNQLLAMGPLFKQTIEKAIAEKSNITWLNSDELKIVLKTNDLVFYKADKILLAKGKHGVIDLKFEPSNFKNGPTLDFN